MKKFEEYLITGEVKKVSPDKALARSLQEFAEKRMKFTIKFHIDEESSTFAYEATYDALRELIDSILIYDGYKSYSHAASISYLQKFKEITTTEIYKLDNAREKRNRAKYYGKPLTEEEAKDLLEFYKQIKPKINLIFNRLNKNAT